MTSSQRILGLDPGTRLAGYGLIEVTSRNPLRPHLLDGGVIRLDEKTPLIDRLLHLERDLDDLLAETRPGVVALEELYSHYNHPRTAIIMAHARGVMMLVARRRGLPVLEFAANRVKQSLTGHGHASKDAIQRAIQATWNLADLPEPPDVADALAVALCCARSGLADGVAPPPLPAGAGLLDSPA